MDITETEKAMQLADIKREAFEAENAIQLVKDDIAKIRESIQDNGEILFFI